MLSRIRTHIPKLIRGAAALAVLGAVGGVAHDYLRGDCCFPGASCCHPGATCCALHHHAQK